VLRYSNLADKTEIAQDMAANSAPPPNPLEDAKVQLTQAQAKLTEAQATQASVTTIYSATQAGAQVGAMPQVASLADEILASAGFVDQNAPPVIPTINGPVAAPAQDGAGLTQAAPPVPITHTPSITNTDPVTPAGPASPRIGVDRGIEKPGVQP
jgi:hypothetical protein